ncbi:MAG: YceI family protein [Flavobacterium sp.]|jgi:polyisoprenoid-binding protein YceI|nr:YceI family protein [Flavobacterium sp.]
MKKIILVALLLLVNITFGQRLLTRSGEIKFDASMPNLIEIAGKSNTVSAILDQATGQFATSLIVKSIRFKVPLMEEHFNENYMESSKYPNSTFKGKIAGFDAKKLVVSKVAYDIEGDLTIHGISKKVKTKIYLSSNGNKVAASGNFLVHAQDYGIEIPSLVKEKFADQIKVSFNFDLDSK